MHGKHANTLLSDCMSPKTKLKSKNAFQWNVYHLLWWPPLDVSVRGSASPFTERLFLTETAFSQKSLRRDPFIETTLPFTETSSPSHRLPLLQRDAMPPLLRDPLFTETPWKEHRTMHRDPLKKYGIRQPDRK